MKEKLIGIGIVTGVFIGYLGFLNFLIRKENKKHENLEEVCDNLKEIMKQKICLLKLLDKKIEDNDDIDETDRVSDEIFRCDVEINNNLNKLRKMLNIH